MNKNKWLIALSAVALHVSIGSVYAWSVLAKPLMTVLDCTLREVTGVFSVAILFLGTSAGLLGNTVERLGPRKAAVLATVLFNAGLLGAALAVHVHSLPLLYLTYGCIGGAGLGVGYIAPVSTLVKYFINQRGLATGMAIMGFGFAATLAAPVLQWLTVDYGVITAFLVSATVYTVLMACAAAYIDRPRTTSGQVVIGKGVDTATAVRTWRFALLWLTFFLNITAGIGLLAVASPMAQETVGMSAVAAAALVGFIGLINGGGRFIWASSSDRIGRRWSYASLFVLELAAFMVLGNVHDEWVFRVAVSTVVFCYGGGFALMPAYLSDLFGTKCLSAIHGRVLTAWGAAGVAGPTLIAVCHDNGMGYSVVMYILAVCMVVSLLCASTLALAKPVK